MKKVEKLATRIFAPLVAALLIFPLSGCAGLSFASYQDAADKANANMTSSLTPPAISESGKLKVGYMEKAGSPQYAGDVNNQPTGLDIDVAAAVASELGLNVEFYKVSSTEQARKESLDMVMGVSSKNANGMAVVSSYLESGVGLFSKGEQDQKIESVSDLTGKSIGYVKGSATETIVTKSNLKMQQQTFKNLDDAFQALQEGKVDYVAAPAVSGANLAMDYDDIYFATQLSAPTKIGIGVNATNSVLIKAIEDALNEISRNGVLNAIDYCWTGTVMELGGDGLTDFKTSANDTDVSGETSGTKLSSSQSYGPGDGSTAGANALHKY